MNYMIYSLTPEIKKVLRIRHYAPACFKEVLGKPTGIEFVKSRPWKATCCTKGWWGWEYENPTATDLSLKSQSHLMYLHNARL